MRHENQRVILPIALVLALVVGAVSAEVVSLVDGSVARVAVTQAAGDGYLRVSGPDGVTSLEVFAGEVPDFTVFDAEGNQRPDGGYTWELRLAPVLSDAERTELERVRSEGGSAPISGIIASKAALSNCWA